MKKFVMLAVLCSAFLGLYAESNDSTQFVREGKNFTKTYTIRTNKDTQTEFTYTIKGGVYNIWITPRGRCYIIRTSKKGNDYKQYVCEEICRQICDELGVKYDEN